MNQSLICQYQNHDSEPIIGFCLNEGCNEQAKYCSICILHKHQEHKIDCQSIVQIKSLIKITHVAINNLIEKVLNDYTKLLELINNILYSLRRENDKILELQDAYHNEEYQKLSDNVKSLKIYHQISKRIDLLCSVNYLDQLEKLHGLCESLNSLSYTQSKMEKNVSGEIDLPFILNQGIMISMQEKENSMKVIQKKHQNASINLLRFSQKIFKPLFIKVNLIFFLGCVLFELKCFQDAIQCFDIVLQLDRFNYVALNNKGLALISLQMYQEAIYSLDQAIKLNPNDPFVQLNKGNALNNLNRKEEAKELIQKAIQKYPFSDILKTYYSDLRIQILGQKSQTLEEVIKSDEDLSSQSSDFIRNNIMSQQNSNENHPTQGPKFITSTSQLFVQPGRFLQNPLPFPNQAPPFQPQSPIQGNPYFQQTMQTLQNSNPSINQQRTNNPTQQPPIYIPQQNNQNQQINNLSQLNFEQMFQSYFQNYCFPQHIQQKFQTSRNQDQIKLPPQFPPNVPIQQTFPQDKLVQQSNELKCQHFEHGEKKIMSFCKKQECKDNLLCCRNYEKFHDSHRDEIINFDKYQKWRTEKIEEMQKQLGLYEETEKEIQKTRKFINAFPIQIKDIKKIGEFLQLNQRYKQEFESFIKTLKIIRGEIQIETSKDDIQSKVADLNKQIIILFRQKNGTIRQKIINAIGQSSLWILQDQLLYLLLKFFVHFF